MTREEKLWLIEPGDVLDTTTPVEKPRATVRPRQAPRPQRQTAAPAASGPAPRPASRTIAPPPATPPTVHSARRLAFAYLLGPLSVLSVAAVRPTRGWLIAGLASAASLALLLVATPADFAARLGHGAVPVWTALALFATVGGCSVWAYGIRRAASHLSYRAAQAPAHMRRAAIVALVGLLPGAGLLMAGRRRAAAAVVWALWPAALAALVLMRGPDLWRTVRAAIPGDAARPALEAIFATAAVALALGVLLWIVQALQGMRVVSGSRATNHGDRYALALAAAGIALVVGGDPTLVASQLDEGADALRAAGLKELPLRLTLAAGRLDPSRADYTVQAHDLYVELERPGAAARLRAGLDRNHDILVAMREAPVEAPAEASPALLPPAPDRNDRVPVDPLPKAVYYGALGLPVFDDPGPRHGHQEPPVP